METNSFLTHNELLDCGFKSLGSEVLISRKSSFYSPNDISIGNNVRIDDFCILSGKISLGNNIHISAFCALYGNEGIILKDFSGLSPRCTLLSATDNFNGDYLIGPIHNQDLTHVEGGTIILDRYTQLGTSTVVLPSVHIREGAVTGAMTLVNHDLNSWTINIGIPAKEYKKRSEKLKNLLFRE